MANHQRGRVNWRGRSVAGPSRQRGLPPGYAGGGYGGQPTAIPGSSTGGGCPPKECYPGNYPNVNDNSTSCQGGMCDDLPPTCGANVLGFNTLAIAQNGVIAGAEVRVPIDAGDACRWRPRALFLAAFEADGLIVQRLASPLVQLPFLLIQAAVGSIPQIRRAGELSFGILSDAYSDRKEVTAVDWAPFTSTQNQGLNMTFQSIVNENIHVFGVLWGDNLGM